MSPPSVIASVVRPGVRIFIVKFEEIPVRAVRGNIGSRLVGSFFQINLFPVHPFVEGPAVVEDSVKNHFHATFVDLFHHMGEKFIAGFQVFPACRADLIFGCLAVVRTAFRQNLSSVFHDPAKMRINIVIVLNIVLMVEGDTNSGLK